MEILLKSKNYVLARCIDDYSSDPWIDSFVYADSDFNALKYMWEELN